MRLAVWIGFSMAWFGFFGTNLWTTQVLVNLEKLCIHARLNGATEDDIIAVLGAPVERDMRDGENELMLSYRLSPWWSLWDDGYYIGFRHHRAVSFMDWE